MTDENVPLPLISLLRKAGCQVVTVRELGLENQQVPDDKILETAHALEYALVTFNRNDFRDLHRAGRARSGLFLCKFNVPLPMIADKIVATLTAGEKVGRALHRIVQE